MRTCAVTIPLLISRSAIIPSTVNSTDYNYVITRAGSDCISVCRRTNSQICTMPQLAKNYPTLGREHKARLTGCNEYGSGNYSAARTKLIHSVPMFRWLHTHGWLNEPSWGSQSTVKNSFEPIVSRLHKTMWSRTAVRIQVSVVSSNQDYYEAPNSYQVVRFASMHPP